MLTVCWPCADRVLAVCRPCAGRAGEGKLAHVTNDARMKDDRLKITPYEKYWSFVDLQVPATLTKPTLPTLCYYPANVTAPSLLRS